MSTFLVGYDVYKYESNHKGKKKDELKKFW